MQDEAEAQACWRKSRTTTKSCANRRAELVLIFVWIAISPILFDLTDFPPMDIFYGTHEVMIAYLKDMQTVCKKYGVSLTTHIGEGMMHCWGAMEFVPEAKAVRQEYFKALQ